jgi:tryptophanase
MPGSFSAHWTGLSITEDKLKQIATEANAAARVIVTKGAALVIRHAQDRFQGAHAKGQPHIGGAGSGPNVVTGDLRRSIVMNTVLQVGLASYMTLVGPTMVYGRAVELGLRNGANYPYFHPGVEQALPEIETISRELWARLV